MPPSRTLIDIKQLIQELFVLLTKIVQALSRVEDPAPTPPAPPAIIIPPTPPVPTPPGRMKVIDGRQRFDTLKSGTKPWHTFQNKKNITISNIFWKNHGRIYFRKCENIIIENVMAEYFYSFYFDFCKRIIFRNSVVSHAVKPLNLARGCDEITFENVQAHYGRDTMAIHSPSRRINGDGLIVEGDCGGNKIINCTFTNSADSGLDIKSDGNVIHNLTSRDNGMNGVKDWGNNHFTGVTRLSGNGDWNYFKNRRNSVIDELESRNVGKVHVRVGWSKTKHRPKGIKILSGTYDASGPLLKRQDNAKHDIRMRKV